MFCSLTKIAWIDSIYRIYNVNKPLSVVFSPRTWRCFFIGLVPFSDGIVFSTHVEMFLVFLIGSKLCLCFLHARGDVSIAERPALFNILFSPRTWRCFSFKFRYDIIIKVFSTHVEMFPFDKCAPPETSGFLHARGDVSTGSCRPGLLPSFSPRTWSCFLDRNDTAGDDTIFSTHVESCIHDIKI